MKNFAINEKEFNLSNDELVCLREATKFYENNKLLYSLHSLFDAVYINILRRIEFFGISKVLSTINKDNLYDSNSSSILKRWEKFEQIDIIKSLRRLEIINEQTYALFLSFYKSKINLKDNKIGEVYLFSFFNLLKVELFSHEFLIYDKNKNVKDRRLNKNKRSDRRVNSKKGNIDILAVNVKKKELIAKKDLFIMQDEYKNSVTRTEIYI